jgi:hypothetical protein
MDTETSPSQSEPKPTVQSTWTPELKLQAFKETITGILGITVIVYTLFVAYQTLGFVGDQTKMAQAKDVLTLLLALAGVVLGYYFGRLPADARAADATHKAAGALAYADQVKTKARELADHVAEATENTATRGGMLPDDLGPLRAKAREIANMTMQVG